jgi:NitT/TauT family transport system permease protein
LDLAWVFRLLAVVVLLGLWEFGARSLPGGFLPSPSRVAELMGRLLGDTSAHNHILATLKRVLLGFGSSFLLGTAIGIAMALNYAANGILKPWVMVGLAIPGPVAAIIGVLIFGLAEYGAIVALTAVVFPFVVVPVWNGARAADTKLYEMAQVFRVGGLELVRSVVVPQIMPAIVAGAHTGFALAWKLVVIIESISLQDGVGKQMHNAFVRLNMTQVIAWMLLFTVVMLSIEAFAFRPTERYLLRWRRDATL